MCGPTSVLFCFVIELILICFVRYNFVVVWDLGWVERRWRGKKGLNRLAWIGLVWWGVGLPFFFISALLFRRRRSQNCLISRKKGLLIS